MVKYFDQNKKEKEQSHTHKQVQPNNQLQKSENISKGLILLENKQWGEAHQFIKELVQNEPNNRIYQFFLYIALMQLNKVFQAELLLKDELNNNPQLLNLIYTFVYKQFNEEGVVLMKLFFLAQSYWLELAEDGKTALQNCNAILSLDQRYEPAQVRKSKILQNMGNNQESLKCIENLLSINPKNLQGWLIKGHLLEEQGEVKQAMECYNYAIEIETLEISSYLHKVQLLEKQERFSEALLILELILLIDKEHYSIHMKRGEMLEKMAEPEASLASYRNAFNLKPLDYLVCLKLGDCLKTLGQFDESIQFYDKIILLAPQEKIRSRAYNNKGELLLLNGYARKEAFQCFQEALKIDSQNVESLLNAGKFLMDDESFASALWYIDNVLKQNPKQQDALEAKGKILSKQEQFWEAIECFDKLLAISPNHLNAVIERFSCMLELGLEDEGLKFLETYYDNYKENKDFLFLKGFTLFNFQMYDLALLTQDEILEIEPFQFLALSNKGHCLFNLKLYEQAIEQYNSALLLQSNNQQLLLAKGDSFKLLGKHKEAVQCYEDMINRLGFDSRALLGKSFCLSQLNQYQEALQCLQQIIENDPQNQQAQQQKSEILKQIVQFEGTQNLKFIESKLSQQNPIS